MITRSLFLAFLIILHTTPTSSEFEPISQLFEAWCQEHGRNYSSQEEKLYRLKVFEDNYEFVTHHNQMGHSTFSLALNAYADLTHHEFKASRLGLSAAATNFPRPNLGTNVSIGELPDSLDWRKQGAITQVKDQGSCGACWAFSATGAMEGINKIVSGSLVSLSEQELIDCDRTYNSGCGGGLMDYAYQFIVKNQGIDTEEDYPFQGREKSCNKDKLRRHVVTIDGYTDVPSNNEKELMKAVTKQPVSVGICGSDRAFQLYSKGIFTGPCSNSLDHAVLIVGYGSENGKDYWIVKNSWGTSWGMNGYIHMIRNNGNSEGICGINSLASYPNKVNPNPPPAPPPSPTRCNLFTYCSEGETCCCARQILGICLSWRCCELDSAVCCEDRHHCCPHDYPICDTKRNLCLKVAGNSTVSDEFRSRHSPSKYKSWNSLLEGLIV